MIDIYKEWDDFKTEVANRLLLPQWYELNGYYNIIAVDQFLAFQARLNMADNGIGTDTKDFEDNYQNNWNQHLEYHSNGIPKVAVSGQPESTRTYYSSAGDNHGVGLGSQLKFDLSALDPSDTVTIEYESDVYIRGGMIYVLGTCPFGATFDVELLDDSSNFLGYIAKNVLLASDKYVDFDNGDIFFMPQEYKMRMTVNNAPTGLAAFKAFGVVKLYR